MSDPIADLREALQTIRAAELLADIEHAHDHQLQIFVHPDHYEAARRTVCNIRPDMESCVMQSPGCPKNLIVIFDPSKYALGRSGP